MAYSAPMQSNDRQWSPDQARLSWAEIDDSKVTVHNIRNFRYRDTPDSYEAWYDAEIGIRE